LHKSGLDPILIYSEVDDEGWETRKVEVFADGKIGTAPPGDDDLNTKLSIEPLPDIEMIRVDHQFEPSWISKEEFEEVWIRKLVHDIRD